MRRYRVELEVSGPLAMWARPDTGATPTSDPVPSWGAAKGLLESIAFLARGEAWFHPVRVELCRRRESLGMPISFKLYSTNYGGPLRTPAHVKRNVGMQFFASVLTDVCYRIFADVRCMATAEQQAPAHHLQHLFQRRVRAGACFRTPSLGWREFTCDYWGAFRNEWIRDESLHAVIPAMLHTAWSAPVAGEFRPRFERDVRIEGGVVHYAE